MKKTLSIPTITPFEAGKALNRNAETIRAGLRQGIFDFGYAIPPEKKRWKMEIYNF